MWDKALETLLLVVNGYINCPTSQMKFYLMAKEDLDYFREIRDALDQQKAVLENLRLEHITQLLYEAARFQPLRRPLAIVIRSSRFPSVAISR